MMLERVTTYLQAIEDETRLDLVRRCFYLKVCEKLSRERACVGWRRESRQPVGECTGLGRKASDDARQPRQLENR